MTVKEAIAYLQKLPDKEMAMMVDCPNCGKGHQLERIIEVVLLKSKETEGE